MLFSRPKSNSHYRKNHNEFGLYRDDGLGIIRSKSPRSAENTAKLNYFIKTALK